TDGSGARARSARRARRRHRAPSSHARRGLPRADWKGVRMSATLVVAHRFVLKFVRSPQLLIVGTIQGAMFLLIFRYVFGGAISATGSSYVDFLVPGFVVTTILFIGSGAAAGVAEDIEQGFFDRLRSLPIPRLSGIAGRVLADTGVLTWGLGI